MEVTEGRLGEATILRISGRVDSSVCKLLEQKVQDVVGRDSAVIMDLHDMNYVSSAGLRSFITLAKHAHANNRTVALCGMCEEVAEIFEISGLLELFAVYDSVEAAAAGLPR